MLCFLDEKLQSGTTRDEAFPHRPSKPPIVKNGHANNSPSPTLNVRPLPPVSPSHPTFPPTTTTSRTKVTTTTDARNGNLPADHPEGNEIPGSVDIQ